MRTRYIKAFSILILISGLTSAAYLYSGAATGLASDPYGYDRFTSKQYIHDLKLVGGNFAVLTAELSQWLAGLWHGRSLAVLVAIASLLLAASLWLAGDFIKSDGSPSRRS